MRTRKLLALATVGLALTLSAVGRAEEGSDPVATPHSAASATLDSVASATLDVPKMTDEQILVAAENLRKEGPAGLAKAQQAYFGWWIHRSGGGDPDQHVKHAARWRRLIDLTAQQKDADVSRLFWYTDWELARAEAERTGKPVLRLFMMGRLTDNLSCANSRFFRVALYGNEQISDYLRENYVLCWTSVRPVPVITVDYGDGRKLERTITGNSIHYLVNAQGQLIDVMPGLVSPQTFENWLREGVTKHSRLTQVPEINRAEFLRTLHESELMETLRTWRGALDEIAAAEAPAATVPAPFADSPGSEQIGSVEAPVLPLSAVVPTALEAAPLAVGKTLVEFPLVDQVVKGGDPAVVVSEDRPAPTAVEAAPISTSKRAAEFPLVNTIVADSRPATDPGTPKVALLASEAVQLAIGKGLVEGPLVAELDPLAVDPPAVVAPEPNVPLANEAAVQEIAEALRALPLALSKSGVERPLVRKVVGREEVPRLIAQTTEENWNRIADSFLEGSRLDATSKSLMDRLHSDPEAPTEETCPTATVESFERSIALDTARNLYLHRRTILEWILDDGLPADLATFNERVYGELFLTPSSDPWIGLVPADVFTGIEGEGLFGN